MAAPAQWPSTRRLRAGDALTCEISASWWDHPGQLLRTFAVAAEPTALYRELHAAADAALDAILAAGGDVSAGAPKATRGARARAMVKVLRGA
jgi:Xaa-Pro aminopeptidase